MVVNVVRGQSINSRLCHATPTFDVARAAYYIKMWLNRLNNFHDLQNNKYPRNCYIKQLLFYDNLKDKPKKYNRLIYPFLTADLFIKLPLYWFFFWDNPFSYKEYFVVKDFLN